MASKTFIPGEVLTASDTNTYLANSGTVLLKTQLVGTTVSSVVVTGAFSADYDSYKIMYTGGVHSATQDIALQLGSTTTGYYGARIALFYVADTLSYSRNNNGASFGFVGTGASTGAYVNCDLISPFLSTRTIINAPSVVLSSTSIAGSFSGFLDNNTSYTAFTIIPTGGTLTGGTIRVYGYRN